MARFARRNSIGETVELGFERDLDRNLELTEGEVPQSWSCHRGLLPRDHIVPAALEGKISEQTIKTMTGLPKVKTRSARSHDRFFGDSTGLHLSGPLAGASKAFQRVESIAQSSPSHPPGSAAPDFQRVSSLKTTGSNPGKETLKVRIDDGAGEESKEPAAIPQSRLLYMTLESRGLTASGAIGNVDSFVIAEIFLPKGVWEEIGHTEIKSGAAGTSICYKQAIKMLYNADNPPDFLAIRFTCYRWTGKHADHPHESSHELQENPHCPVCGQSKRANLREKIGSVEISAKEMIPVEKEGSEEASARILKRLKGPLEDMDAKSDGWTKRAWEKLRHKLLVLGDQGHQAGDNLWPHFKMFDTGGAGSIDPREFIQGLVSFNIRPATRNQGQELFSLCGGEDGDITLVEFSKLVRGTNGCLSVRSEFAFEMEKEFALLLEAYHQELKHKVAKAVHPEGTMEGGTSRRGGRPDTAESHLGSTLSLAGTMGGRSTEIFVKPSKNAMHVPIHTGTGVPYYWLSERPGFVNLGFVANRTRKSLSVGNSPRTPRVTTGKRSGNAGAAPSEEEEDPESLSAKWKRGQRRLRIITGVLGSPGMSTAETPFRRKATTEGEEKPAPVVKRKTKADKFVERGQRLQKKGLPFYYKPPLSARSIEDDFWAPF